MKKRPTPITTRFPEETDMPKLKAALKKVAKKRKFSSVNAMLVITINKLL